MDTENKNISTQENDNKTLSNAKFNTKSLAITCAFLCFFGFLTKLALKNLLIFFTVVLILLILICLLALIGFFGEIKKAIAISSTNLRPTIQKYYYTSIACIAFSLIFIISMYVGGIQSLDTGGSSSFTNKYGTSTTKCYVSGCNNYIASSGDTNCCVTHSNKCLNCHCYIDGDATYCMSCIYGAINKSSNSNHECYICGNKSYKKYGSYYYCYDCLELVKKYSS